MTCKLTGPVEQKLKLFSRTQKRSVTNISPAAKGDLLRGFVANSLDNRKTWGKSASVSL